LRTLLLETIDEAAHAELAEQATTTLAPTPYAELDERDLTDVDAIITRGSGRVTSELISRCPNLRVIGRCGVGLDNVDVDAATTAGIAVINAPGSPTVTTAEHTLMLILALTRQLYPQVAAVKDDDWAIRSRVSADECAGKTLGVIGLGAIGCRVAEMSAALGMEVIAHNRTTRNRTEGRAPVRQLPLAELLAESDIVTLHVALTLETRGLIGRAELATMQPGSLLVNAARGALVDVDALLSALDSGRLAGYAADGVDPEPPALGDRLIHHPRTIITPHSAALTTSTYRRTCLRTVRNVLGYLTGSHYEAESVFNAAQLPSA
jgi:phosphoglycerate dehydrogenase-like enzyme